MKPIDKLNNLQEIVKLIESLEDKLFSFYKSRDINSWVVSDRVDEYNEVDQLPEAYCSAMYHFNDTDIYSYRDVSRSVYFKLVSPTLDDKFKKAFENSGSCLDDFNVYEKIKLYDIFGDYLGDLTKELNLITIYVGLPERTQKEIDRRSERIRKQFESWEKNEVVGE